MSVPSHHSALRTLAAVDLTSADGRAGIRSLLTELERHHPGLILQSAATIQLRGVGGGERQAGMQPVGGEEGHGN